MTDIFYEVRFTDNPVSDFTQKFRTEAEARDYAMDFSDAEIYEVEVEYSDYFGQDGEGELVSETKLDLGTEETDTEEEEFTEKIRLPKEEDDLDEDTAYQMYRIYSQTLGDTLGEIKSTSPVDAVNDALDDTDTDLKKNILAVMGLFGRKDIMAEPAALEESLNEDVDTAEATVDDPAKKLIATIKATNINLRTLHRNLVGGNWFTIHELIGEWYEKLDELEDKIVENLISLGAADVKADTDAIIDPSELTEDAALQLVRDMFDKLMELSNATRQTVDLPTSVTPVFDELENFLQVEGKYKLDHYFDQTGKSTVTSEVEDDTQVEDETVVEEDNDMSDEELGEALFRTIGKR